MPNTKPVIDTKEKVEEVHNRAKTESPIHVIQLGAVTKGQKGEELADIQGMAEAGCMAISEDGKSVMNASLYRKGMKEAKKAGLRIFAHCEDITMVEGGVMNADAKAEALGLKGITNSVEDVIVARDILLAKETGVRLHPVSYTHLDVYKRQVYKGGAFGRPSRVSGDRSRNGTGIRKDRSESAGRFQRGRRRAGRR